MTRIGDIVALEDVPVQRAANLASVMESYNKSRKISSDSPFMFQGAGFGTSGQPQKMDLQSVLGGLKSVLPSTAPAPYDINPAALQTQAPPTSLKIPARAPDEILAEAGITPPATGINPGMITPPPETGYTRRPGTILPQTQLPTIPSLQSI